jgi:hypothetical protein
MVQIKKKEEVRIHFKFIVRLMIYEVDYNCINNCKVCCTMIFHNVVVNRRYKKTHYLVALSL